jgi:hypothetical protein
MKRRLWFFIFIGSVLLFGGAAQSQQTVGFDFKKRASNLWKQEKRSVSEVYQYKQGFRITAWLGNNATIGRGAFIDFNPTDGVGVEYPVASGIEHLYGGGPWIGAIVDTSSRGIGTFIKAVTTGYGGGSGGFTQEMFGHQSERDTFYHTSILNEGEPNKRNFDDDGDGLVDEDELDGEDNDGDWDPMRDDLGSDGLPDSLETGCKGTYDPLTNPDPAFDNYDTSATDLCRRGFPLRSDRMKYTQNNGLPDRGEPHVDEDYGAISESDVYVSYTDTYRTPVIQNHIPLGIKIWQRSYTWATRVKEPIIIVEYNVINVGRRNLDSVYLGFYADADVGPVSISGYYTHNFSGYIPEVRTAYAFNAVDRPATPIGVTVLGTPKSLDSLKYTFRWHPIEDNPATDYEAYTLMSSGIIMPNQPIDPGFDTQFYFGFGPFDVVRPNDTLKITVAILSGESIDQGFNNIRDNAVRALELFNRGYTTPEVPPSPPLRITQGHEKVTLDWCWRLGDPLFDPQETWDDSNKFVDALPDTHWRRRNPPPGKKRGGRIFEGYRLWRSESPVYNPSSFALLREYDVIDDLNFNYGVGIECRYVDSNLVRGRKYWYAVTSFSIPGASIVEIPLPEGGPPRKDTLVTPAVESDLSQNVKLVQLPFSPSTELGKVKVVPNPYRVDADYTYEGGGWEGLSRSWTENDRVIWFIHLPPKCTIHVFTLAGDVVTTIEHDDTQRTTPDRPPGQEEWNLLSESGRAIASGIYVFVVDSEFGKQVGKFVVIR